MSNNVFRCSFTAALFVIQHAITKLFNLSNAHILIAHNRSITKMVVIVLDIKQNIIQNMTVFQNAVTNKILTVIFLTYKM